MGRLAGKVAFITGASRGQGRSHAVRMAEEGADIIAVDICEQIGTVPYELGTMEELEETMALVEKADQRCVIAKADVRSLPELQAAVAKGVAELGRLDIVSANAGIWSAAPFTDMPEQTYRDMIDVQMHGAYYTCQATVPQLLKQGTGGSIIITSSTAGISRVRILAGNGNCGSAAGAIPHGRETAIGNTLSRNSLSSRSRRES